MTLIERNNMVAELNPIKCEKINLHFLQKYVDDIMVGLDKLRKGVVYLQDSQTFQWDPEASPKQDWGPKKHTMDMLC